MCWQVWDVQGKIEDIDLPAKRIYAELCHDAQRMYAQSMGLEEQEIEWIQHEPAIDQFGGVDI